MIYSSTKKKIKIIAIMVPLSISFLLGLFIGWLVFNDKDIDIEQQVHVEPVSDYLVRTLSGKLQTDNPIITLKNDLIAKPEIIPYGAVLGGTMGFYDVDHIRILNDKWLYAPFEDGHIGGAMILHFEIEDDKSINWRVVESYLD